MTQHRSLLLHGLGLTLRRFPALLWVFAFNFVYSAITTARISNAIGAVTNTSLAARPLHHGFDLGIVGGLFLKLNEGPGLAPSLSISILLYFATYFLIIPGTLFCYQTEAPARLSGLLQVGLLHFWRFVRITVLTTVVMGIILGFLVAIWSRVSDRIDASMVGRPAFVIEAAGFVAIALVAAVLRLYFDLVEVYTVQLGLQLRPSGKPDCRVRKTLLPAFRALRLNFSRAYLGFLFLAALGIAAIILTGRITVHSLAQPRVWPMFLFAQVGLFLLLLTRFWQRGAETSLALDYPIFEKPVTRTTFVPREQAAQPIHVDPPYQTSLDPIPDPEPAVPSLSEPDPAIFRHDVPITPHVTPEDLESDR